MKRSALACVIAAGFLITIACNKPVKQARPGPPPVTSISLDSGISYIRMYSELCRKRGVEPEKALRAFTIPRDDLFDMLGMDTLSCSPGLSFAFNRARAYVGYTFETEEFHLIFTPVVDDGTPSGKDTILTDQEGTKIVFDLTTPCPNTCDLASPLYQAFDKR